MKLTAPVIAEQLRSVFGKSDFDAKALAKRIQFHARFVGESGLDDLAALLFIRCAEQHKNSGELSLGDITRILSRVQKEIYRIGEKRKAEVEFNDQIAGDDSGSESSAVRDLIDQIKLILNAREFILFQLRFVESQSLDEIATGLGTNISAVHREIRSIQAKIHEQITKHS